MKTFRLIYLSLAVVLLSACQAEIWEPVGDNILKPISDESPVLTISSKTISAINASETKTVNQNPELDKILSKVNDLNIRVHLLNRTHFTLFCNAKEIKSSDKNQKAEYIKNEKNLYTQNDGLVQIHLKKLKSSQVDRIEVIANYGSSLASIEDWSTVKETGPYDPVVKDYCMMYGFTSTPELASIPSHPKCKNYAIKLKRSRAMFSVKIIDNGIATGLTVTPKYIRFYNMPTECKITALGTETGNQITSDTQVAPVQEKVVSAGSLVGTGMVSDPRKCIGTHDETNPIRTEHFFFPFENKQGTNPNASAIDKTKYPKEITAFPDSLRVAQAKLQKNVFKYTYLEIVADYIYRTGGEVTVGGTVIYRLFLGANTIDNFDIVGNTYYRVNLSLKNFAGADEDGKVVGGTVVANNADNSWRVDMETQNWGFDKSQYDFDAHMLNGYTTVVGTNWSIEPTPNDDGGDSWLVLNIEHDKTLGDWVNPTKIASNPHIRLKIVDGKVAFNIQPMVYQEGARDLDPGGLFDEKSFTHKDKEGHIINYREQKITVRNNTTQEVQTVVIRQYVPVPIHYDGELYFMERFEEYDIDNDGNEITGYQWLWNNNNLTDLYDQYGNRGNEYKYDNQKLKYATYNAVLTSYRKGQWGNPDIQAENKNSAMNICYEKGSTGVLQGAPVQDYILPTAKLMEAMFTRSKEYIPDWGPFEPMHIYDEYWTQTVPKDYPTQTLYYDPTNPTMYPSTDNRLLRKRVRAVYAPNSYWPTQDS